jgi:hypothetical protein
MLNLRRKGKFLGIRLGDEEMEVIENIKNSRGYETISDAIRELIRFAEVYFDERLTVEKAFKPHILGMAKENFEVFVKYPVSDLLKPVPELKSALTEIDRPRRRARWAGGLGLRRT